jgi:iron(II)-dependent oxidoreductase
MAHIFISYSRQDTAVMRRVRDTLRGMGFAVWTDEGIQPGTASWQQAISSAIEGASCLLLLMSPDSKQSEWVGRELSYAAAHRIQIFSLLLRGDDSTSVPFALAGSQYIDIRQEYEKGIERLALVLPPQTTPVAPPPVTIDATPHIGQPAPAVPVVVARNADWKPEIKTINGIEMVRVPAGCFKMGSDDYMDEMPVHDQCFDKAFWIGRYPVTNQQYSEAVSAGVCKPSNYEANERFNAPEKPVVGISWHDALAFARWKGMRLPTEAEWEYAARGPENWVYPWGNSFVASYVIFRNNSNGQTSEVMGRPQGASWVGAFDMSGNVWEWMSSLYEPYPYVNDDLRENLNRNAPRVLRGGGFIYSEDTLRCSNRYKEIPQRQVNLVGFRCAFNE